MKVNANKRPVTACAGATLIEVLVTLSILSLGLAGLSATQLRTLEHLRSVANQSRAVAGATDMAEQLRALLGEGRSPDIAISRWRAEIGASLPAGAAAVCIDGTPRDGSADSPSCDGAGLEWAIKIWWDDDRDGEPERIQVTTLRP
ncbi:MAG: prepilin-type N-terminal cleavage/methylation domain-containing protein [Gammaproteobacteria bacterium]|nr:prepilin-type N-terminal cleavage/methylation domain-containing protein [Gammaproteobacteria bacterium]MXZ31915.1 prepilin-type N-terminal cleavage/methylation domain-containing protein [Gammaproteobacteria bacterium]MYC59279.1 prepilin-type N-terminal cleavage/methylation domain-containing protein [Gammaproteobacteria bacterium]MYE98986.1 prepilin-type N-terminal cleavage/methylation domain-containing protein [Gammaproteobacteria bacterium]MYG96275.1 prepilin-type N-terminal cleavage/methyl